MSTVLLVGGTCAAYGNLLAGWAFTYDGDGSRVRQVYTDGTSTLTTFYFAGSAYEVRDDGTTGTVWKYYAFAGMTVAVNDGSGMKYLLTDLLGSIITVTNASAVLLILGYRLFCSRKSVFLSVFLSPIYKCQVASRSSTAGVPSYHFGR